MTETAAEVTVESFLEAAWAESFGPNYSDNQTLSGWLDPTLMQLAERMVLLSTNIERWPELLEVYPSVMLRLFQQKPAWFAVSASHRVRAKLEQVLPDDIYQVVLFHLRD